MSGNSAESHINGAIEDGRARGTEAEGYNLAHRGMSGYKEDLPTAEPGVA